MDKNKDVIDIEPEVAIAKVEPQAIAVQQSPIMQLAEKLSNGDITPEQMEKMLDIQFKWEANEARKAYHAAMTSFKADPPVIVKDLSNAQYRSSYASISNVAQTINTKLSEYGLSARWETSQKENGWPEVTCIVTHSQGHSEQTTLSAPPDESGSKNPIQKIISSTTYLKKETLLAITGLATQDETDDDGNGSNDAPADKPKPNKAQQHFIDEVALGLTDIAAEQGRQPNTKLVQAWLFDFNQQLKKNEPYPSDEAGIAKAVKFIAAKPAALELVTKEIKGE